MKIFFTLIALALTTNLVAQTPTNALNPTGNVGIGVLTPPYLFNVISTDSVLASTIKVQSRFSGNLKFTNNTSSYRLFQNVLTATGANPGNEMTGFYITNENNTVTGAQVTQQNGFYSYIRLGGAGNTTDGYAFRSMAIVGSSGSITGNYTGFYAGSPALAGGATGTIAKSYGVYIAAQKTPIVASGYGLYQVGSTDLNYMAGKTGIGVITPVVPLDIATSTAGTVLQLKSSTAASYNMSQFLLSDNITDYTLGRGHLTAGTGARTLNLNVPEIETYGTGIIPKISFTSAAGATLLGSIESASGNWYMKGKVGIGTSTLTEALNVNGNIVSKQVKVTQTGWPDYVFKAEYTLRPLADVAIFIQQEGHLPEVPSGKEISKNGLNLGDMNALLLKKVEELTLYMIEQKKTIEALKKRVDQLSVK